MLFTDLSSRKCQHIHQSTETTSICVHHWSGSLNSTEHLNRTDASVYSPYTVGPTNQDVQYEVMMICYVDCGVSQFNVYMNPDFPNGSIYYDRH